MLAFDVCSWNDFVELANNLPALLAGPLGSSFKDEAVCYQLKPSASNSDAPSTLRPKRLEAQCEGAVSSISTQKECRDGLQRTCHASFKDQSPFAGAESTCKVL